MSLETGSERGLFRGTDVSMTTRASEPSKRLQIRFLGTVAQSVRVYANIKNKGAQ